MEIERCLPLLLLTACTAALAEAPIELAPYVVVAPSLSPLGAELGSSAIEQSKPVDLAEILSRRMPSVALSRKGPVAGDLVVRGLSRDNVVVTVDGMKTYCACPNRMDPPAFHVSSQQIETVSMRAGPFSVENGASTGGEVRVQTAGSGVEEGIRLHAFAGSFGYHAAGFGFGKEVPGAPLSLTGGLYYQAGDVYEDGDGVPFTRLAGTTYDPDFQDMKGFEIRTADARASLRLGGGSVMNFNYGYQDAVDVLYPGLKMDAITDTMNRGSLELVREQDPDWARQLTLSVAFSSVDHDMQDRFRITAAGSPAFASRGYMMRTTSETGYLGVSLKAHAKGMSWQFRYGVDGERRTWDADNEIMLMQNDMLPDVELIRAGAWAVLEYRKGALAVESGARMDFASSKARAAIPAILDWRANAPDSVGDCLPSAYLLLERQVGAHWSLYGGLGHAERLPDPQERFINLNRPGTNPDWVGNPVLEPVANTELQGGMRFQGESFAGQFSLFNAWLSDYIYLTRLQSGAATATSYTGIDASLYGAALQLRWQITGQAVLEAGLAWQDGSRKKADPSTGSTVLGEIPPLRGRTALSWTGQRVHLLLESVFQDRDDRIDPALKETELAGWVSLNALAKFSLTARISLTLGVDNLADVTYAVSNAYIRDPFRSGVVVNEPGRFLYARFAATW